ncbi:MAG: PKD domain-containing protein [Bacteroidetes bacterium]|nr:PKD domain-containing protein [Bacteroidota bacterium]
MIKKTSILLIIFFGFWFSNDLNSSFAQTNVSGGIFSNTTWTISNSPYIVIDNVVVFPGVILTIDPGVNVKFEDGKYLEIRGDIEANGNLSDTIEFNSNSNSPYKGIWQGIQLNDSVSANFSYCKFKYATSAILILTNSIDGNINCSNSYFEENDKAFLDGGNTAFTTYIDSCNFINNNTAINLLGYLQELVINSTFKGNNYGVKYSYAEIINCKFCNHSIAAIQLAKKIKDCLIYNNNIGIDLFVDSIVNNIIVDNNIGINYADPNNFPNILSNTICNNTTYNFKNNTPNNLSLEDNCWCTTDSTTISNLIYDGYDTITSGLVDFTPFISCDSTADPSIINCSIDSFICPNPFAIYSYSDSLLNVTFISLSSNVTAWLWDFGDGNTDSVQNPVHTYADSGTYNVCLTVTDLCGSGTSCTNITVSSCPLPVAAFNYNDSLLTVQFSDSSANATKWFWDYGDGNTDTIQNPTHTYAIAGTYNVCLTTSNDCGSDTSTICNSITLTITGIQYGELEKGITIYPNPFSTFAIIKIKGQMANASFVLYDIVGREAKRIDKIETKQIKITRDNLPSGMYFYKLKSQEEIIGIGKVIID